MKIYDESKTQLLEICDLDKGYLKEDTLTTHYDEIQEVKEQGHYQTIAEYPNGGKDVEWIVDIPGIKYQPARDEIEEIYVYIPYTESELLENKKNQLRKKRETECFTIINRGKLWYDHLTNSQIEELNVWYKAWLDVTATLLEPAKLEWLK